MLMYLKMSARRIFHTDFVYMLKNFKMLNSTEYLHKHK